MEKNFRRFTVSFHEHNLHSNHELFERKTRTPIKGCESDCQQWNIQHKINENIIHCKTGSKVETIAEKLQRQLTYKLSSIFRRENDDSYEIWINYDDENNDNEKRLKTYDATMQQQKMTGKNNCTKNNY